MQLTTLHAHFANMDVVPQGFVAESLHSASIHLQSNLVASYIAGFYTAEADPVYIALSSGLGLGILWVLGKSIGAHL
jgi:hypothetical protein